MAQKKKLLYVMSFINLLSEYAEKKNLVLIAELPIRGTKGKDVTPDGTLKNILRLDYGYWESKDESLDLDEEIDKKIKKGYPLSNILFEDSNNAVLIQNSEEVMRIDMSVPDELDRILNSFITFEKPEVRRFNEALEKFQVDIPTILVAFRDRIDSSGTKNKAYISASETFLELCKAEINPDITAADIREMMIQHILTSDIFNIIFGDSDFHKHNSIARELEKLIGTLFTYSERKNLLANIQHYYDAINATASSIADHHEKQKFLKALYENFYKAYNPKAADRLGVVYTPNEMVDFMIDGTNYLLEKHFKRLLWDKNVEILDPATGTGTYICNMIDKCPKQNLAHKYKNEMFANEVAILPYYIANLNIEFTFKQKMTYYEEFPNICFVDTLDNTDALAYSGKQHNLFGLSSENTKRISRQNSCKISVIIGNPPYNANQKNENENNKNREYPDIDKRIKDTFVKYSTAQKTKVYDMYARFYRYAFDRLDNNGVVAFVTNRSFINSRTFDGFRKCIQQEFDYAYIIDTKSDIRANPKIAGTTHNVFGIQTGIAIMFLVKKLKRDNHICRIQYFSLDDFWRKEEKLRWLSENSLEKILFEQIQPDKNNNWINIADTDFDTLLPLASKDVKLGKSVKALFELFTTGVNTSRDEWVFDINSKLLADKINYFIERYTKQLKEKKILNDDLDYSIKWSDTLKSHLKKNGKIIFDSNYIINYLYRPFFQVKYYSGKQLSDRLTANHYKIFGEFLG